jgi:hypothetical protein
MDLPQTGKDKLGPASAYCLQMILQEYDQRRPANPGVIG